MKHCKKCGQIKKKNGEHICSISVWNKGKKGLQVAWNKGKKWSENSKEKIRKNSANKGKPALNKGIKTEKPSWNKGTKGIMKAWNKGKKCPKISGKNNCNWKGGITPKREQERKRLEVKLWRKSCFERDNFTCQKYGVRTGGLVVHHINNFSEFPELQTAIKNGITLSEKAHKEFHDRYGYKHNTKEQLLEFLGVLTRDIVI